MPEKFERVKYKRKGLETNISLGYGLRTHYLCLENIFGHKASWANFTRSLSSLENNDEFKKIEILLWNHSLLVVFGSIF